MTVTTTQANPAKNGVNGLWPKSSNLIQNFESKAEVLNPDDWKVNLDVAGLKESI